MYVKARVMANLKTMILNNSDKLNDSEKKIIQFVVNNPESYSKLSLSKLAKKLYISESAIFRLCKKLGLSGYSELKFDLDELASSENRAIRVHSDFANDLLKATADVVKYFHSLNLKNLYQAFDNASMVYLFSTGWEQQLIAQYISHELFMVGLHTTILPSAVDELKAAGRNAKKGDVLFIISFSGDSKIINEEIAKLKLRTDKFVLVSLTNMKQNKLASLTQYNMYFPTVVFLEGPEDNQEVAFTPAYCLVDLLVSDYSAFHNEKRNRDVGSK